MRRFALAALIICTPALAAPPPATEIIFDRAALAAVLTGDWYPLGANGEPKPKSSFTFGKAACTAARTAEFGADFSVRRGAKGLETSIGVGFSPVAVEQFGDAGVELRDEMSAYLIHRLTDAADGSPRIWVRDEGGSDTIYQKCPAVQS